MGKTSVYDKLLIKNMKKRKNGSPRLFLHQTA